MELGNDLWFLQLIWLILTNSKEVYLTLVLESTVVLLVWILTNSNGVYLTLVLESSDVPLFPVKFPFKSAHEVFSCWGWAQVNLICSHVTGWLSVPNEAIGNTTKISTCSLQSARSMCSVLQFKKQRILCSFNVLIVDLFGHTARLNST